jgi:hypothetical protein
LAKDHDLEAPGVTKPWTMPPEPKAADNLPPLPPVPGLPRLEPLPPEPAAPASKPLSFEDHASRMGREIVKLGPLFRIGAVLVVCGALVLAAENVMIATSTSAQLQNAQSIFQNPGNNTTSQSTGDALHNMQGYFAMLNVATQLDIIGFSALGFGIILIGVGSRFIVFRNRYDSEEKRPSVSVLIPAVISGAFCLMWVMYTQQWRQALFGTTTPGDWTFIPSMFNVQEWVNNRGTPPSVAAFAESFPRASERWIMAAVMMVPAALFFYIAGWRLKKETGIRFGGTSWLVFSVLALIATVAAISATIGALEQAAHIDFSNPDSWQSSIAGVGLQLGVAAVLKLLVVPAWATLSFALLAVSGFKLLSLKPGKVVMSDKLLKAILKAQPSQPAAAQGASGGDWSPIGPPASGSSAMSTALPSPKSGDVVVALSGAPLQPPQPPPPNP